MFKLVIQDDEGKTTVVPLIRDEITIGRKEGNTIRLTERNVSRRHARIVRSNGEVQIEDLGSYNGIRVNNARIAERVSLRISDQVQIGDYKLYLKAEGVEQVDDARTMPIERQGLHDGNGTPVVDPAAASHTPTAPIPTTPPPAQRASLAVADTDPAGRPVATAAQVAALSATAGYGKLVVMSSNFAGKEFELTRPQMIVGRTDENDLVINHRSISRNHAKITRDPETQRYTISDLQSSNGVRVNGQDYGKVELRRGDIVDLGHVRLRFVEPGEEFVFTPAMIADIPDAGGRKGLMVAIILAIVVLGAVGAFFVFKNGGDKDKNGSTNPQGSNDGSAVAIGSNPTQPEHGSNGSAVVINEPPDANEGTTNPSNNDAEIKRITSECMSDVTDRKWDNVAMCADSLAKLDPKAADKFKKQAHAETANENIKSKLDGELANNNLKAARKLLDQLPDESVYHNEAVAKVDAAESKIVDDFRARAQKAKRENRCKDIDVMITQASQASGKAGDAVRAFKCETVVAPPPVTDCTQVLRDANDKKCVKQFCADHKEDSHCPQPQANNNPPPANCNADELREAGTNSEAMGAHAQAVKQFEQALQCKSDPHTIQLTFMASCNAHNAQKAKVYWKRMSVDAQNRVVSMCIRNGIDRTALDAP